MLARWQPPRLLPAAPPVRRAPWPGLGLAFPVPPLNIRAVRSDLANPSKLRYPAFTLQEQDHLTGAPEMEGCM